MEWLRHHFTQLGGYVAHPAAFAVVVAYTLLWWWLSPATLEWHAIATICTFLVALLIQRTEHRDTQAIHAKLDELLRSHPEAKSELARLDDEEPEDIEAFREVQRAGSAKSNRSAE